MLMAAISASETTMPLGYWPFRESDRFSVPAFKRPGLIAVSPPLFRGTLHLRMAERTAGKQRGRPFRRGESGNPAGRPIGARHKATVAAEALLDGEAERLTRKVLEMALAGDIVAMRLCLERILPPRRERPVRFKLPELQSPPDAAAAMAALAAAVADGDLTPSEAAELSKLVAAYVKALEASDFDQRLRAIEAKGDATRP
jgi:hypothetical protein